MNKRFKHCVQHPRSIMGFVVVLNFVEVPRNAPLGDVIHSCDMSAQHAGDCTTSPKWDFMRSQLPSWQYPRTAQPPVTHSKWLWESLPASPATQGQGHQQESCSTSHNLLSFTESPQAPSLPAIQNSKGTWADMRKACILAMVTAPLSGDWTQVVSCKCALHHSREAFPGGSCILCVLWTDVQTILEQGIQESKGSCGEELNKSNILFLWENKDYIKEILINNPVLHRKHKALIPLSLDWLTWKAQL